MKHDDEATRLIIKRILAGDINAFEKLLTNYSTFAYNIAFRIVRNRADAEEVVQDSFLRAFKYLNKFRGEAKFSTWLYTIVSRIALTRLRQKREMDVFGPFAEDYDTEEAHEYFSDTDEEWEKLRNEERERYIKLALNKLSPHDNLVLTLYYINENSVGEICEILNCNTSACKVKLLRARKRLLVELEGLLKNELKDLM